MEEKKEKVEKKDNRGKHVVLVTVLVVILMGVSCAIGYALGGTKIINIVKEEKIVEQQQQSPLLTHYLVSDLSEKLGNILGIGTSESISMNEYTFRSKALTEKLTEADKQLYALKSVYFRSLYGSKWHSDEGVRSFIERDPSADVEFGYVDYATVNKKYKELFGEELTNPLAEVGMCPHYNYNAETQEFYRYPARCGGTSAANVLIYKSNYELKDDEAYVYFYVGSTFPREGAQNGYVVYNDLARTEIIEEVESGYPNDYSITKDNADKFSQYKAIFKNDGTDNLAFQEIVQVK